MVLHEELGINSLGELEYACRENRLTTLKGFGAATQKKILASLEEISNNSGKVRLDEALHIFKGLELRVSKSLKAGETVQAVGELARHCEIVQQLELLVVAKTTSWQKLFSEDELQATDVNGNTAGKIGLWQEQGLALQVYTATLGSALPIRIFHSKEALTESQLQWLNTSPESRGKLEAKPKTFESWSPAWLESIWINENRKPSATAYRSEKTGPVKGIFHCHTTESDGTNTLEEMVEQAQKLGYEYIGIADHSQSAFYAQGLKPDAVRQQRKRIANLQKKMSIRIFHGIESDILVNGSLDYDKDVLKEFDFIVGSIHSRFKMERQEMTERVVNALQQPGLTILGHPSGRLLLARKAYELDWERCLEVAQESGASLEINANPHRLDIDWRLGASIEKRGVSVCINPDAHSTEGIKDTMYGEWMAEKAMIPAAQILNLRNVNDMESYLAERKIRAWR